MVLQPWFRLFSVIGVLCLGLAMVLQGCKLDNPEVPTSPTAVINPTATSTAPPLPNPTASVTVTTPLVLSPQPGTDVSNAQPSLVVSNATTSDGAALTYSYRVATDDNLSNIIASVDGVPQGTGGQTSWQVPQQLGSGRYYWRAQATTGTAHSTPSALANFTIGGVVMCQAQTRARRLILPREEFSYRTACGTAARWAKLTAGCLLAMAGR